MCSPDHSCCLRKHWILLVISDLNRRSLWSGGSTHVLPLSFATCSAVKSRIHGDHGYGARVAQIYHSRVVVEGFARTRPCKNSPVMSLRIDTIRSS